jgi:hypothetical protein
VQRAALCAPLSGQLPDAGEKLRDDLSTDLRVTWARWRGDIESRALFVAAIESAGRRHLSTAPDGV